MLHGNRDSELRLYRVLACLLCSLCQCNVYREPVYKDPTDSKVSDTSSATHISGNVTDGGKPDMDAATALTASAKGSSPQSTMASHAGTESCSSGRCWWSHAESGCQSVGAPTGDDRPSGVDGSEADVGDIFVGWSDLSFGANTAGSASPDQPEADGAWQHIGLDLDGVCTNSSTCPDQKTVSCKPVAQQTPYDGEQCRDNSLATILTVSERLTDVGPRFGLVEDALNCGLHRGTYNMIARIRHYNGKPDDPNVRVDWYVSGGLEELPDWKCDLSQPERQQNYPLWRASAKWTIDRKSVAGGDGGPENYDADKLPDAVLFDDHAYVRGEYLVSRLPDGALLRLVGDGMPFHGLALTVRKGLWLGRLRKGQDNTWGVSDGVAAGRSTTSDIMQTFRRSGFCTGEGLDTLYQSISTYVVESADVLANGKNDASTPCDALSFGFGFTAEQVTPGRLAPLHAPMECCPPGHSLQSCVQVCGDGKLGNQEACDTAIPSGQPGACPTRCNSDDPCRPEVLMGEGCNASCVAQPVTALKSGDNCCPKGADASKDADCAAVCGNGVIEEGETCDPQQSCGSCKKSDDACLLANVTGSAAACTAECVWTAIVACASGDMCCPQGCNTDNDRDCPSQCGDGKLEVEAGETCEPNGSMGVPTCPSDCDDHDACTQDIQTGSAQNCNVRCSHMQITKRVADDGCCPSGANAQTDPDCQPHCGNAVVEKGESCDDGNTVSGDGCDASCQRESKIDACLALVHDDDDACARCVCEKCGDQTRACYGSDVSADNQLCGDVVACIRKAHCQGADCYCGTDLLRCSIVGPAGQCKQPVEAASRTSNPTVVAARANDTKFPIGRASALGECTWNSCAQACNL